MWASWHSDILAHSRRLELFFPLGIRHAINTMSGILVADFQPALVGFSGIPFGQTVAAETGQIHQVNILYLFILVKMLKQTTEGGRFKIDLLVLSEAFGDRHWILKLPADLLRLETLVKVAIVQISCCADRTLPDFAEEACWQAGFLSAACYASTTGLVQQDRNSATAQTQRLKQT